MYPHSKTHEKNILIKNYDNMMHSFNISNSSKYKQHTCWHFEQLIVISFPLHHKFSCLVIQI